MKANYKNRLVPLTEIENQVRKEFEKRTEQVYETVKQDIAAQLMAVCCCVLHSSFGFGEKRLKKFKKDMEDYFSLMLRDGICGKEFTPINCIEYMRKTFNIDFDEEITIKGKKGE